MGSIDDGLTAALVTLFGADGVALLFAAAMVTACAGLLGWVWSRRVRPLEQALGNRVWALWGLAGDTPAESRRRFYENRVAIATAMEAGEPGAEPLRRAWRGWRETVIDPDDVPWRTPDSAAVWFGGVEADLRLLGLWANLFVAVGLIITFLGVIAALTKATAVIGGGAADPSIMQGALADLLSITATKFWTSVAGLACSVALRLFERRWASAIERQREALIERLDDGTEPVIPHVNEARRLALTVRQTELLQVIADRLSDAPASPRLRAVK